MKAWVKGAIFAVVAIILLKIIGVDFVVAAGFFLALGVHQIIIKRTHIEPWKVSGVFGGIWGLVSILMFAFWAIQSVMVDSSTPLSRSSTEKVLLLPGYLVTTFIGGFIESNPSLNALYNYSGLVGALFILLVSMALGALIVIGIFHVIKSVKIWWKGK